MSFLALSMLACTGAFMSTGSNAAGSFDGNWVGTSPAVGDCGQLVVKLLITDGKIAGTVAGKHGSPSIDSGVVAENGSAQVRYAVKQGFRGNIQFSGNNFRGSFDTFCGSRETIGSRGQAQ
jgi:hypothetical protein